jgi:spore germination protein YaaH
MLTIITEGVICVKKILVLLFFMLLSTQSASANYTMTYVFGGTPVQYSNYVDKTNKTLNTIAPDNFDLTTDGNLYATKLDHDFVEKMHRQNIQVTPFLSNHWDRAKGEAALNNIPALTDQIKQKVLEYNLDGVNIDIENVNHFYRDRYTLLVQTLRQKLPDKLISVAVAANPNNWQVGWHGSYDYAALARNSDYLMVMGYDESYFGGPAGPVASSTFVEGAIRYALKYTTPDKIVLGIPFFGRYWQQSKSVGGYGITAMDVEYLLQNYSSSKTYHADSQSAQVSLTINEQDVKPKLWGGKVLEAGTYTIWYDDLQATQYKLNLAKKYGLKGIGSWALGQENTQVWSFFVPTSFFDDIIGHWAEQSI